MCLSEEYESLCGQVDSRSEDFNECTHWQELCAPGKCINTPSGYECDCPQGFVINRRGE